MKKTAVREKISKTVLEILGEKKITDIKISELTERAKVARASFYRNFNSIDDVLDYIADKYKVDLNKQIIPLLISQNYEAWYNEVKKVLKKIYDGKEKFTDVLTDNLRVIFLKIQQQNMQDESHSWTKDPHTKYEHIAKISAFYSVCLAWLKDGAVEPIDSMTIFILEKVLLVK